MKGGVYRMLTNKPPKPKGLGGISVCKQMPFSCSWVLSGGLLRPWLFNSFLSGYSGYQPTAGKCRNQPFPDNLGTVQRRGVLSLYRK